MTRHQGVTVVLSFGWQAALEGFECGQQGGLLWCQELQGPPHPGPLLVELFCHPWLLLEHNPVPRVPVRCCKPIGQAQSSSLSALGSSFSFSGPQELLSAPCPHLCMADSVLSALDGEPPLQTGAQLWVYPFFSCLSGPLPS